MRRLGRRLDVDAVRRDIPLSSFFFDCLYLEGEGALIARPYAERLERLKTVVEPGVLLPRIVTSDPDEVDRFFDGALAAGHEGLMAKSLAAPYAAGQRGFHWMKLKPAHTLDLVILAVERGSGRRQRWLSNLHLGARDAGSGQFVMLGNGWTVVVRPELVAEIAFSDVQESPRYPAGLALRFARVKRYRPEKPAAEADTLQAVRAIFDKQRA
jgi:DNA ligase-1